MIHTMNDIFDRSKEVHEMIDEIMGHESHFRKADIDMIYYKLGEIKAVLRDRELRRDNVKTITKRGAK